MRKKDRSGQDVAASETRESEMGAESSRGSNQRRLTPVDIQQRVFRLSVRGYNEREVDQFLDEVTEEVARLHAENKRLREDMGTRGTARLSMDAAIESDAMIRQARAEADRIIEEARSRARSGPAEPSWNAGLGPFLSREKGFLQSLASLIQRHAEGVKDDAQRARDEHASRSQPTQSHDVIDLTSDRVSSEDSPPPAEGGSGNGPSERDDTLWAPADQDQGTEMEAEPPRQLEAAEVDGSLEERSIRELFWGED